MKTMGTFTPIAMKCNKEQFEAIKPKLKKIGKIGNLMFAFEYENLYLVNNFSGQKLFFDISYCYGWNRTVHEEWNEEIFLKTCGVEFESLEQQLQKAESEVKRLKKVIEEENIKLGDWVHNTVENSFYKIGFRSLTTEAEINQCRKINNPQLIVLLEQEIK